MTECNDCAQRAREPSWPIYKTGCPECEKAMRTSNNTMACPQTEAHVRHMEHLKRVNDKRLRDEYIDGVRRSEGKFFANWLMDAYAAWHKASRASKE